MKLEVGKEYKCRNGSKVRLFENEESGCDKWPFYHDMGRGLYHAVSINGKSCVDTDEHDIVSEWREEDLKQEDSATSALAIFDKAANHMKERAATYDSPDGERSMKDTVDVFNRFHGTTITEAQGWHFMQILKDVRLFAREGFHADSAEDCVAYAALKAEAKARE